MVNFNEQSTLFASLFICLYDSSEERTSQEVLVFSLFLNKIKIIVSKKTIRIVILIDVLKKKVSISELILIPSVIKLITTYIIFESINTKILFEIDINNFSLLNLLLFSY